MARTKQQARAISSGFTGKPFLSGEGLGIKSTKSKAKAKKAGLDAHTVIELKEMAKTRGVSLKGLTKKDQIIKALEGVSKTTPKKASPKKASPKKVSPKTKKGTGAWLLDDFDSSVTHIDAPIFESLRKNPYDISGWFGDWMTNEDGDERKGKPLNTEKDLWKFFDKAPLELGDHSYFLIPEENLNKYASKYFEMLHRR